MKLNADIVINAKRELVWDEFNKIDDEGKWQVTERRRPAFIAGNYVTNGSTAVVVNQFEELGLQQTKWLVFANYRFNGAMRFLSFFGAGRIRSRTVANMERFKLFIETRIADQQL